MKIKVGYRASAKVYKRSKKGKYQILKYCLFDMKNGKPLVFFDHCCPQWKIWAWFRYFNFIRGVSYDFIKSCTPEYAGYKDYRAYKIAVAHERVMSERISI